MRYLLYFFTAILVTLLSLPCRAANTADEMANQFFSDKVLPLSPQEKNALVISRKWQVGNSTSKPFVGGNGAVTFVYGSGQTQILCAVLQVCDVALAPGESVNNLNVGDPRFLVEKAVAGGGGASQIHMLIKPLDVGLDTSLVVTTNMRVYHLRLKSHRTKFMPYVSFTYPDQMQAAWEADQQTTAMQRSRDTLPATGEYLGNLSFDYAVQGEASWKPERVYNNGTKTIIEMPATVSQKDAPALLVLKEEGGFFSDDKTAIVNYRMQNNRYIVDSVFDKAVLVAGVGDSQEKVTIVRGARQ